MNSWGKIIYASYKNSCLWNWGKISINICLYILSLFFIISSIYFDRYITKHQKVIFSFWLKVGIMLQSLIKLSQLTGLIISPSPFLLTFGSLQVLIVIKSGPCTEHSSKATVKISPLHSHLHKQSNKPALTWLLSALSVQSSAVREDLCYA